MTATTAPRRGTRFTVDTNGTAWTIADWTVTSVRHGRVHATPTPAYDRGLHRANDSWDLAAWTAAYGAVAATPPLPAAAVAAEAPRDAITVVVPADEDDDVMRCSMFGHEMVNGACDVCGQPDPDAALARTVADAALGTLHSNPGDFGAALAGLGFGEMTTGEHYLSGSWWRTEHESGAFRVIGYGDDGDRVTLIGWDPERPLAKLEAWRVEFSGSTPQSVVLAAIANTVGVLPVTR